MKKLPKEIRKVIGNYDVVRYGQLTPSDFEQDKLNAIRIIKTEMSSDKLGTLYEERKAFLTKKELSTEDEFFKDLIQIAFINNPNTPNYVILDMQSQINFPDVFFALYKSSFSDIANIKWYLKSPCFNEDVFKRHLADSFDGRERPFGQKTINDYAIHLIELCDKFVPKAKKDIAVFSHVDKLTAEEIMQHIDVPEQVYTAIVNNQTPELDRIRLLAFESGCDFTQIENCTAEIAHRLYQCAIDSYCSQSQSAKRKGVTVLCTMIKNNLLPTSMENDLLNRLTTKPFHDNEVLRSLAMYGKSIDNLLTISGLNTAKSSVLVHQNSLYPERKSVVYLERLVDELVKHEKGLTRSSYKMYNVDKQQEMMYLFATIKSKLPNSIYEKLATIEESYLMPEFYHLIEKNQKTPETYLEFRLNDKKAGKTEKIFCLTNIALKYFNISEEHRNEIIDRVQSLSALQKLSSCNKPVFASKISTNYTPDELEEVEKAIKKITSDFKDAFPDSNDYCNRINYFGQLIHTANTNPISIDDISEKNIKEIPDYLINEKAEDIKQQLDKAENEYDFYETLYNNEQIINVLGKELIQRETQHKEKEIKEKVGQAEEVW